MVTTTIVAVGVPEDVSVEEVVEEVPDEVMVAVVEIFEVEEAAGGGDVVVEEAIAVEYDCMQCEFCMALSGGFLKQVFDVGSSSMVTVNL